MSLLVETTSECFELAHRLSGVHHTDAMAHNIAYYRHRWLEEGKYLQRVEAQRKEARRRELTDQARIILETADGLRQPVDFPDSPFPVETWVLKRAIYPEGKESADGPEVLSEPRCRVYVFAGYTSSGLPLFREQEDRT